MRVPDRQEVADAVWTGSCGDIRTSRESARPAGRRWIAVSVLAPVLVFWEAVVGRRVIAPGDGLTYYLPLHHLVVEQWRSGAFPAWDRGTFGGSPLFAVHQSAALHPATLARVVLPPVLGHNLTVVAALVVAGIGAHLLAHRLTGDHVAGAVAGCAFALCGFQFAHLGHVAILSTTAWLPWSLWAADRLVERLTVRRFGVGAGVVALAALSGHGQMLAYVLAATAVYTVVVVGRRLASGACVATMVLVGLALAAVQLVPVAAALGTTDRSAFTLAEATAYSHDPGGLLVMVAPFLYGGSDSGPVAGSYAGEWTLTELGGYVGAAALVLAVAGLAAVRRDRRVIALLVIGGGSLLVALGDSTPLSHVVHAVPVVGQMRSWARYTVGTQLAVAVLAAVGVARARSGATTVRPSVLAAGSVLIAVAVAVVPGIGSRRVDGSDLLWAVGIPGVAALAAAAVLAALQRQASAERQVSSRRSWAVLVALVAVVAADPVVGFGWWYRWRSASPSPGDAVALMEAPDPPWGPVPDAPGGIDRYLWAGDALEAFPYSPRMASAGGSLSVTGMDPLAPSDYLEVTGTDYWGRLREPSRLLGSASHLPDLLRVTVVAGRSPGGGAEVTAREPALPEAFVVGSTRRVSRSTAVDAVVGKAPLDPGREAVVEVACGSCPTGAVAGRAGDTGAVRWSSNGARVRVVAERAGLLVVSQAWSPGWSATVDGRSAPVLRVDGVVQGVPVPPGTSDVVLRYRPPGLRLGGAISATAVVGLGIALAVARRHRQLENHNRASSAEGESSIPVQTG